MGPAFPKDKHRALMVAGFLVPDIMLYFANICYINNKKSD